ncbi:MAG: hypothetical protein VKO39_05990 [Cyanobacteriota bacterium]|nr:hypothetical protein [Cyanobacteriota bacterium]
MVATLAGLGALLFGLALLLLPLLANELSRPGDSAWGALVLVLALVLATSAERLSGSPMLAVLCGGLLVGRLTVEVGRGRWRQLTPEERGRLGTRERWQTSLQQARAALAGLLEIAGGQGAALLARWGQGGQPKASGKRWVRPEKAPEASPAPAVIEVSDFAEIDALLQAAPAEEPHDEAASPEAASPEAASPEGGSAEAASGETASAEAASIAPVSDIPLSDSLAPETPPSDAPGADTPPAGGLQDSSEGPSASPAAAPDPAAGEAPAGEPAGGAG